MARGVPHGDARHQPRDQVLRRGVVEASFALTRIGFVTQDDVLFPQLTVEETLVFAALLRLPTNMPKQQKLSRVNSIIKDLNLERCPQTKVGGGFVRGISGGERKRTSIGYEILVDPSLLLLDEPTSGLDSTSASKLLMILQSLAKAETSSLMMPMPSSLMEQFSVILQSPVQSEEPDDWSIRMEVLKCLLQSVKPACSSYSDFCSSQ